MPEKSFEAFKPVDAIVGKCTADGPEKSTELALAGALRQCNVYHRGDLCAAGAAAPFRQPCSAAHISWSRCAVQITGQSMPRASS